MDKKGFEVHCTWNVLDDKNITAAVTWTDGAENGDIEEMIQAENCILLESPNEDDSSSECRLLFFCQPPYRIQQVTVLCESRLLEIYGRHAEYLKTIRNKLVDEVDDMIVFRGEAKLEIPTTEASIKFTGLKSKSSMWLYGVKVTAVPTSPIAPQIQIPNFNKTEERNNNNMQFDSFMNSLPSQVQQQQPWQTNNNPLIGLPTSTAIAQPSGLSQDWFQHFLPHQQQTVQPDMAAFLAHIAQFGAQQQYNVSPLLATLMSAATPLNQQTKLETMPAASSAIQPSVPPASVPPTAQPPPVTQPLPITSSSTTPLTTTSVNSQAATTSPQIASADLPVQATSQTTPTALQAPPVTPKAIPITTNEADGDKLRELAFELRPETVDQITEAVVTNMDCSIENLEARLWGKIVQRLSDMEGRIMRRMEEIVEALREAEEEDDDDIIREEEEEGLSAGSDLQI